MFARTKTKRPACAVALASALVLALGAPAAAFAADLVPPEASDAKTVTAEGATQEAEITGTVKATTITVSVPTKVTFYLDPGATQSTDATNWASNKKIGQYTNPTNFTITNLSAVDVYGYVSKVRSPHVSLVNAKSGLSKPGGVAPSKDNASHIGVMVGLADTAETLSFDTPGDWLTVNGVKDAKDMRYYAFNKANHGRLSAAQDGAESKHDGIEGSYTMTVRGAVFNGGWSQDENFLVAPTFKIVTTDPSTVA